MDEHRKNSARRNGSTSVERLKKEAYERPTRERQLTWGDIYWKWVRRGVDRAAAAFMADEWERRKKAVR
jgi:hypothetical protein